MSRRHTELPNGRIWQYAGRVCEPLNVDRAGTRRHLVEKCSERLANDVVDKFLSLDKMPDGTLDASLTVVVLPVDEYRGLIAEAYRAGQADGMLAMSGAEPFPTWTSSLPPTTATKGNA